MIDAITIEGYKSIKAQEVKLSPINILIGGNGIGKTNFISAFELIRDIYEQQLQNHVLRKGGANCLLYNGKKYTDRITVDLLFTHDHSKNRYIVVLEESQDRLFVKEAKTAFLSGAVWHIQTCDTNKEEASIKQDRCGQAWYVGPLLEQFEIYHFHDTGDKSPMKDFAPLHDNVRLKRDGSNIAPYLYLLKQKYLKHYLRIEKMVASVSPFFDSFVLEPNRLNPNTIRLEWKQKDVPDMTFNAYQLSDGSLRFICLAALLMQPEPPQTILIDEPELGLHPLAINKLCAMLKKVSSSSQIIVSTQSVNLVDNFAPEDIIVADRKGNETVFCRLDGKDLEEWLKDYSMGELWEKKSCWRTAFLKRIGTMEKGNRLVFIVEGDCEVAFINKMIIPYLYKYVGTAQWSMNAQKITTNRKLNRKGGNVNYAYLKNEVERVAAQQGNIWITTFLDFFRLPNDFPNYSLECRNIDAIEEGIKSDLGYERLVPYIQKYEFETLLFVSMDGFNLLLDDSGQLDQIQEIIDSYANVEDINGGVETAPSKRLSRIFDYNKVADSGLVLDELDVETMRKKCPRFDKWIEKLIGIIQSVANAN